MKLIKLTQGKFAIVDNENFELLSKYNWHFHSSGYARTSTPRKIYMHRIILGAENKELCDHINRNKLDNRKSNLRIVNATESIINTNIRKDNTSGYKGVSWDKSRNKWQVFITSYKKTKSLGRYEKLKEAIKARKQAERIYHYA